MKNNVFRLGVCYFALQTFQSLYKTNRQNNSTKPLLMFGAVIEAKMKISVKLDVSENKGYHTFDLDDIGVTEQEWNEMSESEKHYIVEKAVFDLPEQPYWMVDSFGEI